MKMRRYIYIFVAILAILPSILKENLLYSQENILSGAEKFIPDASFVKKLQENKNIKISVVGHTDTSGTSNYNYALGGRRAEAVQKLLIKYAIPASQIVAVSAGEEDLAVPTPDNTPNAENRRVRVVKEVHYTEEAKPVPMEISVEEYSEGTCGEYGCQ